MHTLALSLQLVDASPEMRLFLVKYLQKYGTDEPVEQSVEEIVAALGVTDHVVTDALNYLSEDKNGYLRRESCAPGKGRPRRRYICLQKLKDLYNLSLTAGLPLHQLLIDDLLLPDVSKPGKEKRHPLNTSNRLLLAVLLSQANKFGMSILGFTDISKLTGMSRDRLDSQLMKLKKLGYIRSNVVGVTGCYLFGKRKGIYVLNLRHINFGVLAKSNVTTLISFKVENGIRYSEAYSIRSLANASLNTKRKQLDPSYIKNQLYHYSEYVPCNERFVHIAIFFRDLLDARVVDYFQVKLEEYASFLLSNHWDKLTKLEEDVSFSLSNERGKWGEDMEVFNEALEGKVQDEIVQLRLMKVKQVVGHFSSEQQEIFIDFVCATSVVIAKKVQCVLNRVPDIPFDIMSHVILPSTQQNQRREYIAVDSYYQDETDRKPQWIVNRWKNNAFISTPMRDENQLLLLDKYSYGLLTTPKA